MRPREARRNAASTLASVSASKLAVISSRSSTAGLAAAARAIDSSCHSPCENIPSVHTVAYPSGRERITSSIPASFAAFCAISSVTPGSESVICSSTVPGTREKCCSTQPMHERRSRSVISATSTPPMVIVPDSGLYSPSSKRNTVLLPAPVLPARVTCSPALTVMEKSRSTGFSPYPKVTWENTTSPRAALSLSFGISRSG